MNRITKVRSCDDCPFKIKQDDYYDYCSLIDSGSKADYAIVDYSKKLEKCPLKLGKIIIEAE